MSGAAAVGDAVRLVRQLVRSEEPEVGKYLRSGLDQLVSGLDSVDGLSGGGFVGRVGRVFQFIASPAEGSEWAQDRTELGPDGFLDCVVAA